MCGYCWDLDDYEARHGHRCTEDCASQCDECGLLACADDLVSKDDSSVCTNCNESRS